MEKPTNINDVMKNNKGPNNESSIRSNSQMYNQGTIMKQLIHEEVNTAMNYHTIIERIKAGTARDISAVPKCYDMPEKTPAFVLGSGPSLDDAIPFLKNWAGGIFCTTSHALTLMRYGIEPTHIVALDPFCTWDEIAGIDWSKTNTKLITHPGIWPSLLQNWPNEMYLYIENLGRPDSFYATTQKRMFTWREDVGKGIREPLFHYYIPTEITLFACSPPIQMFCADILGYGTIFLSGVDFAYSKDKDRFTDYTIDIEASNNPDNFKLDGIDNKVWIEHKHPYVPVDDEVTTNNGLKTHQVHLYYKKNMLTAWRLSKQTVYTTDHGAITEIPFVDIEHVIKKNGYHFNKQSPGFIADSVEKYLASVGAFVVETKAGGMSFVESVNVEKELTNFMYQIFNEYHCPECKQNIKADNRNEHVGELCPTCKKGKLVHINDIDIPKHIDKYIRLLKENGIESKKENWK